MHIQSYRSICAAAIAVLVLNACGSSDKKEMEAQTPAQPVTQAEPEKMTSRQALNEFALNQLHHINQKEIAMAELAEKKSSSTEVKRHAQAILIDHRGLEEQLKASADAQNIKLADFAPSTWEKNIMSNLEKLEANEFEQAYLTQMMLGHQFAQDQLKQTRAQIGDMRIARLIDHALPRIQRHYKLSRQMVNAEPMSSPSFAE